MGRGMRRLPAGTVSGNLAAHWALPIRTLPWLSGAAKQRPETTAPVILAPVPARLCKAVLAVCLRIPDAIVYENGSELTTCAIVEWP